MASVIKDERSRARSSCVEPESCTDLREFQDIIDGLVEQIAIVDCGGTILAVNESWRRQVERQSRVGLHISRDYVRFLKGLMDAGDEGVAPILKAFQDVSAGSPRAFRRVYNGKGAFAGYDFNIIVGALTIRHTRYVLVSVHDITELVALKRQRRRSDSEVLRAQEVERRRIARELHDSTSQMLVALQLNLAHMSQRASAEMNSEFAECSDLLQDIHAEIRTFSFLAHPPSLIGGDLAYALRDYARGFSSRTGVTVEIDVADCGEMSASVEAALYRLSQEALANIHRHAGATQAGVRLIGRKRHVHLLIHDNGIGFEPTPTAKSPGLGVGVMGMRERVRELGGRLSIHRALQGTAISVSFPRMKRMVFAS